MKDRSLAWPLGWTALHAGLWLVPIATALIAVPQAERVFADFGVSLPGATVFTIKASHVLVKLLPSVVLAMVVMLAADFALIRKSQSSRTRNWPGIAWIVLMTALPLVAIAGMSLSISGPMALLRSQLAH